MKINTVIILFFTALVFTTQVYGDIPKTEKQIDALTTEYYDDYQPKGVKRVDKHIKEYARHIDNYAEFYGIDQELIITIIHFESRFDQTAIGDHGTAFGSMQCRGQCRRKCASECYGLDIFSIQGGVCYGSCWLNKGATETCKTIEDGLNAYCYGECKTNYPSVQRKVNKRLKMWNWLKGLFR